MAGGTGLSRREFLRASARSGFAFGSLLGLGMDLRAAQAEMRRFKIANVKEVPSVCPYCAVGCGQLVSVRDGQIINIEGNPESPINQGTLCPKGAATYQLAVNPNRITHVLYRKPGGTAWETVSLDWAMDRIAQLVKKTRDATFQETWHPPASGGHQPPDNPSSSKERLPKKVNHTLAIASLGGATMDNEWNYIQTKLMRALGVVFIENQARI